MKNVDLEDLVVSEEYFKQFMLMKPIKIGEKQNDLDKIVLKIAFIFDLNFECSKQIIKKEQYIERILKRFEFKNEKAVMQIEEIKILLKNIFRKRQEEK